MANEVLLELKAIQEYVAKQDGQSQQILDNINFSL